MRISDYSLCLVTALLGAAMVHQDALAVSFGVNFSRNADEVFAATTMAGAVPQANWNQGPEITDPVDVTLDSLVDSDDASVAGLSVHYTANNTWASGAADTEDGNISLLKGYLDDGGGGSNVEVTGIPYPGYDLYIYGAGDQAAGEILADYTVTSFPFDVTATWMRAADLNPGGPLVDGSSGGEGHYYRIPGLSSPTLTITGVNNSGAGRAPLAGFQIVESDVIAPDPALRLVVDRDNGQLTLENHTGVDVSIAGLSTLSDAGALVPGNWISVADNYDKNPPGNESVSSDEWVRFVQSNSELGEGTLGTGLIAQGQQVDLGAGVWLKNPNEDLQLEYLDAATGETIRGAILFTGTTQQEAFPVGDYNFDGVIDQLDWPTQRDNYQADLTGMSMAEAYLFGDLDGDRDNDVNDQLGFKAVFLAANPGASLASAAVPEPSSILLLAMAGILFGGRRLTRTSLKAAPLMLMLVAVLLVATIMQQDASAVSFGVNFNRNADEVFASTTSAGAVVQENWNQGPEITEPVDVTLDSLVDSNNASVPGLSVHYTANNTWASGGANTEDGNISLLKGYLDDGGSGSNVDVTGIPYSRYDLYIYGAGDQSQGGILADYTVTDGVDTFNASWLRAANLAPGGMLLNGTNGGEGHYYRVGGLTSTTLTISAANNAGAGRAPLAGFQIAEFEPITLRLDPDSGYGEIRNNTNIPVEFEFYEVSSDPSNSLTYDTWYSLQDQDHEGNGPPGTGNGWEELGNPGQLGDNLLAEFFLDGNSTLDAGEAIPLGKIFNTESGVQDDIGFRYHEVNEITQPGAIEFAFVPPVDVGIPGDYNGSGQVEQADLDLVLLNWGAPFEPAPEGWVNDLPTPESIDQDELDGVLLNWGDTAPMAQAVPEPSGGLMLWVTALTASGLWSARRRKQARNDGGNGMNGLNRIRIATVTAMGVCLLGSSLMAAVTNDRVYQLGDDMDENASNGAIVGSGSGNPVPNATLDTGEPGDPVGSRLDLIQTGDPIYTDVSTVGGGRPGSVAGDLGIRFDGGDDRLRGIRLNRPDELATLVGGSYPFNYTGITVRGLQGWVYPDQAGIAAGKFQSIVFDSIYSGGPAINELGQWSQINSFHADGLDADGNPGTPQVPATVSVPAGDTWYHVMHHNYTANDPAGPRIVTSGGRDFISVLYVDGVAVSATSEFIRRADDDGFGNAADYDGAVVVGAAEVSGGGHRDYFQGVLDDLNMYVYGDNTSEGGQDWGTFDLFADNEWIANEIANAVPGGVLTAGDVNKDGAVNGNGTGPVESDDVSAFIAGWRSENVIEGVHSSQSVGDWLTWDDGDLDHNGTTNWSDWYLLRANHPTPASLDLASLLSGVAVPEPSSTVLALLGGLAWFGWARRR